MRRRARTRRLVDGQVAKQQWYESGSCSGRLRPRIAAWPFRPFPEKSRTRILDRAHTIQSSSVDERLDYRAAA